MSEAFFPVFLIGLAPFVGSFLGVLTVRLPQSRPVGWSRSRCDHCGQLLAPKDLFPVASWLWLRGRCRYCGALIGWLPLLMEIAAIVVAVLAATETTGWVLFATCALGWTLVTLAVIDWRAFILPDALTLPLIPAGLIVAFGVDPSSLLNHGLAATVGLLGAILLAVAYRQLRGRDGLGLGDAKLLAGLGAWLGLDGLPTAILFAASTGIDFRSRGRSGWTTDGAQRQGSAWHVSRGWRLAGLALRPISARWLTIVAMPRPETDASCRR